MPSHSFLILCAPNLSLSAKEKKGIFSSFHSAAGILPLRVFAEDAAAERIIQSVKSANHGPKHIDLYKKWIDDPKHGQLE